MEPEPLYNLLQVPGRVDPPPGETLSQGAGPAGRGWEDLPCKNRTSRAGYCIAFLSCQLDTGSVQPLPMPSALYLTPCFWNLPQSYPRIPHNCTPPG